MAEAPKTQMPARRKARKRALDVLYEADVRGVPVDGDGMRVDVLGDLLAGGLRPKIVYTIPDYQNPTGLSMNAERRHELVRPGPAIRLPDP